MKLSVIVPNYNGGMFLRTCLDSILRQTYKPHEIIITDDASTDKSVFIAREYASKYPNVKLIAREENFKLAKNKHDAILNCEGDYITTLDSDDFYINPYKLENEMGILQNYLGMGITNVIAFSRVAIVDKLSNVIRIITSAIKCCSK